MKRAIALLLTVTIAFSLAACGKSEAVKAAEAAIEAIGEVTLESEDVLASAEAAYAALSSDEASQVKNYDKLTSARAAFDELAHEKKVQELKDFIVGEWIAVRNVYTTLSNHSDYESVEFKADGTAGDSDGEKLEWEINEAEDGFILVLVDYFERAAIEIIELSGYEAITIAGRPYLKDKDFNKYEAQVNEAIVAVDINIDNIGDYIGEPVCFAEGTDSFGEPIGCHYYNFTSNAYSNGLIFMGASDDFAAEYEYSPPEYEYTEYVINGETSEIISTEIIYTDIIREGRLFYGRDICRGTRDTPAVFYNFTRAKGTLYFLKSEYVNDYTIYEDGSRSFTFFDLKLNKDGEMYLGESYIGTYDYSLDDDLIPLVSHLDYPY